MECAAALGWRAVVAEEPAAKNLKSSWPGLTLGRGLAMTLEGVGAGQATRPLLRRERADRDAEVVGVQLATFSPLQRGWPGPAMTLRGGRWVGIALPHGTGPR